MLTPFFWKKTWTWIKHYWYWPVIIVLLLFSIFTGASSREKLINLLFKQKESYDKEIKIIKEVSEEASKKKTETIEDFVEEIKKIEQEHEIKVEDLQKEKQKELETTIQENRDKPDKLAREVAKILSVKYHENNR
jgi:archaellum biogenesis ATPase FlaH